MERKGFNLADLFNMSAPEEKDTTTVDEPAVWLKDKQTKPSEDAFSNIPKNPKDNGEGF